MNPRELVKAVAERAGGDEAAARRHVDAVFESVMDAVSAGERVVITGFGAFDRFSLPARSPRNPRNGHPVEVPAALVPRFRFGQTFRNRVAQSTAPAEEAAAVQAPAAEAAPAVEAPVTPDAPANGAADVPARPKKAKKGKKAAVAQAPEKAPEKALVKAKAPAKAPGKASKKGKAKAAAAPPQSAPKKKSGKGKARAKSGK
jgi:DNA-binding protein HU-beta